MEPSPVHNFLVDFTQEYLYLRRVHFDDKLLNRSKLYICDALQLEISENASNITLDITRVSGVLFGENGMAEWFTMSLT